MHAEFLFPYLEESLRGERLSQTVRRGECPTSTPPLNRSTPPSLPHRPPVPGAQLLCPDHPVTGKLFGKTGLVWQRVVGEHGVVSRGAGAVGVLTGGGVLLEGHRQVQVLLSGERSEVRAGCRCRSYYRTCLRGNSVILNIARVEVGLYSFARTSFSFIDLTESLIYPSIYLAAMQGDLRRWRSLIKPGRGLLPAA